MLGGKDHFAPDRELAERILAIYPGARRMARENRRFLFRALGYVLVQGIAQYIDFGAGLPTSPAVHEIVRRHSTRAAVLYVDNDPVVISHLRALATGGDDHIADVPADLTDPEATLFALRDTGLIDFTKPACVILAMVLHFLCAAEAQDVAAAYTAALAPGSHVIITVGRGEEKLGEQVTSAYDAAALFNHTPDDVAGVFTGLDLIDPGIVDARAWMPRWPAPAPFMLPTGRSWPG